MRQYKRMPVAELLRDETQPRKHFDPTKIANLSQSLVSIGQLIPIIVFGNQIIDGEMRYRAALLANIKELDAVVLEKHPSAAELLIIQASIDIHRQNLGPMERSNMLARAQKGSGISLNELSELLKISQAFASKLLSFQRLAPAIQDQLDSGQITDLEKVYIISQEPDHSKQMELLEIAGTVSREQLRRTANGNGQPVEMRASKARFTLTNGVLVTVEGRQMTLLDTISALQELVKELRQGQRDKIGLTTVEKVLADKAKAAKSAPTPQA